MSVNYYSACPFCGRVFEHDGDAAKVNIDGVVRRVCLPCVPRMPPPAPPATLPQPNGDAR
jgi:hypothetical protein